MAEELSDSPGGSQGWAMGQLSQLVGWMPLATVVGGWHGHNTAQHGHERPYRAD